MQGENVGILKELRWMAHSYHDKLNNIIYSDLIILCATMKSSREILLME